MKVKGKRGLSPVIATVLLVSIALVLAVIIFLWARNFVGESITKEGGAIELLCDDISFEAEIVNSKLYLENRGTVPIYAVEVRERGVLGDVSVVKTFENAQVLVGETSEGIDISVDSGTVLVVPLLLGEVEGETRKKAHLCDTDYGKEIQVN